MKIKKKNPHKPPFWSGVFGYLTVHEVCVYLRQILLAQRTVGVMVQAALQTFEAEGVTAGSGHWLIEQSGGQKKAHKFNILATDTSI